MPKVWRIHQLAVPEVPDVRSTAADTGAAIMSCPKCRVWPSKLYARCPKCGDPRPAPSPRDIAHLYISTKYRQYQPPTFDESNWLKEFVGWQVETMAFKELRF